MRSGKLGFALLAWLSLVCATRTSLAEAPGKDSASARALEPVTQANAARAWADGVPEERQQKARALFDAANVELKDSAFAEAAAGYRIALEHWDHPGVHYNLALALINLDRPPLEVREHLVQALRFGSAPLDPEKFDHAKSYLKLLEQNLVSMEIGCSVPDATVSLGDRFLFRGPGRYQGFVEPGEGVIRATKPGFAVTEMKKTLLPGRQLKVDVKLYTAEQLSVHQRRWPVAVPYVVTAGGALIGAASAVLLVQSNHKLKGLDDQVGHDPACSSGCTSDPGLADLRSTANTYRTLATVGLASGGAIFALGTALTILNLPVERHISPEEREQRDRRLGSFALTPALSPGYAALFGRASF